jgi:hypothetical protein
MSEKVKFIILLCLLLLSVALVIWLSRSYTQVLINPNY